MFQIKLWNFWASAKLFKRPFRDAPYDEIAYHIRKSRGLQQPWQAEEKFGPTSVPAQPETKPVRFHFDPKESLETAFLGFVSRAELETKVLKGKAQYTWSPCTNLFRSAPFYIEHIIYIFNKTTYLNEDVNRTDSSPSVSIPWFKSNLSSTTMTKFRQQRVQ